MYQYTLKWDQVDKEIKKGDRFYCHTTVIMDEGDTAYLPGKIYTSEIDGCITDHQGIVDHEWRNDFGEDRWWHFFRKESKTCAGSCNCEENCVIDQSAEGRPDRDYFQSVREEYNQSNFVRDASKPFPKPEDFIITTAGDGVRTFETGAVRDSNEGKSRPDLISPYFTERLGHRLAYGIKQGYPAHNWEMGIPDEAFLESLERHLVAYKMGKTDEDHAAAIAFNIMGIIHNEEVRK